MDNKNTTFKFSLISGVLKRGAVKTKIKSFCFHSDIDLELDEDKGLLESSLLYKFTGAEEKIERLKKLLEGLKNQIRDINNQVQGIIATCSGSECNDYYWELVNGFEAKGFMVR